MGQNDNNNHQPQNDNNNFFNKNPLFVFALFSIVIIFIFKTFVTPTSEIAEVANVNAQTKNVAYYEIKELIKKDKIESASISDETIIAISKDTPKIKYIAQRVGEDTSLISLLDEKNITYSGHKESKWFTNALSWILYLFIFFALWMFVVNRMQKNMGSGILGTGNSKKLVNSEKPKVKFSDVAGVE
jgi:cell division protease FtsH